VKGIFRRTALAILAILQALALALHSLGGNGYGDNGIMSILVGNPGMF